MKIRNVNSNAWKIIIISYQAVIQFTCLDKKILISFAKCFRGDGRVLSLVKPVETNKSTLHFYSNFFRSFFSSSVMAALASIIMSALNCYSWTSIPTLDNYF